MNTDSVFLNILKFRHERVCNEATLDIAKDQIEYTNVPEYQKNRYFPQSIWLVNLTRHFFY